VWKKKAEKYDQTFQEVEYEMEHDLKDDSNASPQLSNVGINGDVENVSGIK
jgi:hypothetical protein